MPKVEKNSIGMEFVLIPPGEFLMGSPEHEGYNSEHPRHNVKMSMLYYLQIAPVTQAQWEAVMGNNPSHFRGKNMPVECVSWRDAREFIQKLNEMEDGCYRLPTEAEWEYACRARSATRYSFGDDERSLREYGWYDENANGRTHPVCGKKPNAWGLYDMHGNVWEWCADWFDRDYYKDSPPMNPKGPVGGSRRVIRGGSWNSTPRYARSAHRGFGSPRNRYARIGFRCVRDVR